MQDKISKVVSLEVWWVNIFKIYKNKFHHWKAIK
jgi:hypothetical protein